MADTAARGLNSWFATVNALVLHPSALCILPCLMLCAYLLWEMPGLIGATIGLTLLLGLASSFKSSKSTARAHSKSLEKGYDALLEVLDDQLAQPGKLATCLMVGIDGHEELADRLGQRALQSIVDMLSARFSTVLRQSDQIVVLDQTTVAIALDPAARCDLETLIEVSGRLQSLCREPILLDGITVYVTTSIGFALSSQIAEPTAEALADAAESALFEARRVGPGCIRAHSNEIYRTKIARHKLIEDVAEALELGHIKPAFQPQLCTDTGKISGFEALARWHHPDRGTISPMDFIPVLERAGMIERLGETILYHALTALRAWDRAGVDVPSVGINFSAAELRNTTLLERIAWELDRFDLSPSRITIEVLESVLASIDEDITQRNIAGLAKLGCRIDLDDFGTGHASIATLRRLSVHRIKIDRSYIAKVDQDRDQQRMVAAILTMAEQLDLDTVAEGVETSGEHSMLAQLGCNHVQGYAFGRPMPFGDTLSWIAAHNAKLTKTPVIGKRKSV